MIIKIVDSEPEFVDGRKHYLRFMTTLSLVEVRANTRHTYKKAPDRRRLYLTSIQVSFSF
ncbi:hypothetical protein A9Q75_05160 [Colwellia psychrerythraea]|uniref:Uncharacterized protein n=1 Tax=Colwellia psychrerythraea TaxID=28229 RepID=A0A1Y5EJU0_COLPS|nr:hypothetical protein A9Q75_05160 [Colwellia psychrerythraea]